MHVKFSEMAIRENKSKKNQDFSHSLIYAKSNVAKISPIKVVLSNFDIFIDMSYHLFVSN